MQNIDIWDVTQEQIVDARDWTLGRTGLKAHNVPVSYAIGYVQRNYPGGWDAFVAEVGRFAIVGR